MLTGLLAAGASLAIPARGEAQGGSGAAPVNGVLKATDLGGLFPGQVFFRGQSASVQLRNSGGVRYDDGMLTMAALVDTSGYSSNVQQKYQGYLISEVPLVIGGKKLPAGEYGVGFIEGNTFLVMDVGAHDLLKTGSTHDAELRRPTPLQIIAAPEAGQYRLYFGRNYVTLAPGS